MPPSPASYCTCQDCIRNGDVDANGVRLGILWTGAAKRAHLKRIQMQTNSSAIAESKAHLATLKRPVTSHQSVLEEIVAGVQNMGISSPVVHASQGERKADKRSSKQEHSRLTSKAHLILQNVEKRLNICLEKLQNPSQDSFKYVEKELPQLVQISSRVTRNVNSIVERKVEITQNLKTLETLALELQQRHSYVSPSSTDESPLRFPTGEPTRVLPYL